MIGVKLLSKRDVTLKFYCLELFLGVRENHRFAIQGPRSPLDHVIDSIPQNQWPQSLRKSREHFRVDYFFSCATFASRFLHNCRADTSLMESSVVTSGFFLRICSSIVAFATPIFPSNTSISMRVSVIAEPG